MKQKKEDCGCNEVKKDPCADAPNKRRILICSPGNKFSNNFLNSWTDMIMWIVNNDLVFYIKYRL